MNLQNLTSEQLYKLEWRIRSKFRDWPHVNIYDDFENRLSRIQDRINVIHNRKLWSWHD